MLRFRKVGFAPPDSFFRHLALCDIQDRADNFFITCLVLKAMCKIVKMLYRTIRHQQPMFIVKVTSALRRALKDVLEKAYIVRMSSLQYQIRRRFGTRRVAVNPSRFLGPKYPLITYFHS